MPGRKPKPEVVAVETPNTTIGMSVTLDMLEDISGGAVGNSKTAEKAYLPAVPVRSVSKGSLKEFDKKSGTGLTGADKMIKDANANYQSCVKIILKLSKGKKDNYDDQQIMLSVFNSVFTIGLKTLQELEKQFDSANK